MKNYRDIEDYFLAHPEWEMELAYLRDLMFSHPEFEETIKWGAPVYTVEGKNVAGLGAFKSYVGIWFFQGALLSDPHQKLINAQPGKTKALRQWYFLHMEEIENNKELIRAYLSEAIQNQLAGKMVPKEIKSKQDLQIPEELQEAFEITERLEEKFYTISPYKRREFCEYISEAKREVTRRKRVETSIPIILDGKGLNDKYRT
ncbi:MAG: hypothetical protein GY751_04250 [Bacteroidetes bacterium]|nr:hypothetical protein [Bacteroidota bacterium]